MKFKYFSKNGKQKKLVIASILGLGIVIGGISLYRSYALYEEEKEYNVLKGQIPDFGYDVKFAVTVDGAKTNKIPERQKSTDNSYYKVQVSCTNGTTVGEWDYNAWNVKLDNISDGSKCTLAFTGDMSKEDYQKYIEKGIATRRNTYRGKKLELTTEFWNSIQNGTFDDIYVGDYIVSPTSKKYDVSTNHNTETIKWLIADIDNYLHTGEKELTSHHLTIIPAAPLMQAPMNTTVTTKGGYYGSKMVSGCDGAYEGTAVKEHISTGTLDEVYNMYIEPDFGDNHIIKYNSILSNMVDDKSINRNGDSSGVSGGWEWLDRKLDLMSEVNVFGTIIWSSSGWDTGIDNRQYAIFQLKPELINFDRTARINYWLKDVTGLSNFDYVSTDGAARNANASNMVGVRPRFLIG